MNWIHFLTLGMSFVKERDRHVNNHKAIPSSTLTFGVYLQSALRSQEPHQQAQGLIK